MKTNKEKVFDFIVEYSKRFKTINDETPKLDTQFLSEKLEMRRSNLSSILNQLVDERKIEKTKGRPVLYYLSTDQEVQIENQVFDSLIGQDLSLKDTIQFTKSAIAYPMRIPRILFTGQKGIGVRTLAEKVYEYACLQRILKKDTNFKIVDCLDYNEKQISEKLIGKENIFLENNHGLILIKNVNVVSKDLISNVIRMLKNNSDFDFILIIHLNEDLDKLDYLRDYFNFMVHIPSLDNRNLSERFQFIEKFFQNESNNLNRSIEINDGLMQCLLLYPCKDNLIELRNNIQFGVANALSKSKKNTNIVIELGDLPPNVRKGLLYIKKHINDLTNVLEKDTTYVFNHNRTLRKKIKSENLDIYAQLEQKYKALGKMANEKEKDAYLIANIEEQIDDYLKQITHDIDKDKIKKICSTKLINSVEKFLNSASVRFNQVYSNKIYYAICLHLNNAIVRNSSKQRISNENIMEIIDKYDEQYVFSRKFLKSIEKEFNVTLSMDESAFITLVLTLQENEKLKKRNVVTLIVMHGSKTAQSIVEVVKLLMPVQNIEAFDLSLEDDPKESYEQLKNKIIEINQGRGILALYDMGSIQVMLDSIMEETKINIRSIEVPIPLLAMSACKQAEEGKNVDDIYDHLVSEYSDKSYSRMSNKDVIIALSSANENNSESIKRYLQTLEDYRDYQILSFNISDKHSLINRINEIKLKGKVIGIVGTYNPDIFNIKFVDYQHLPKVYTIHELFAEGDDDFDIIEYLTEQFEIFNYDDLQNSLLPFVKKLEEIFEEPFTEDTRLGMLIHMGCLIDRLTKKQASAVNFNLDSIRTKYHDEFTMVSEASKKLESTFNVTFSDSDKATIIEIIINNKRRN